MNSRTVLLFLTLAGFSILSQSSRAQVFHLRWQPKVGETHTYKVSVKFVYSSGEMEFDSTLTTKVLKVNSDGSYSLQTETRDAVIHSGDQLKTLPQATPEITGYLGSGLPKGDSKNREADPFSDMLEHLTEFESPNRAIRIGEDWTNHPVPSKKGLFGEPRVTYHLSDMFHEGALHLAKITYRAAVGTNPDGATGSIILNHANNSLRRLVTSIPNFQPEGASEPAEVTIQLTESD